MKTVILWLLIVFILSVYPFKGSSDIPFADKILHFMLYAITCALFFSVLRERFSLSTSIVLSFLLSSGYGFLMEIIQGFIPARSFSLGDELINMAGAASAAAYLAINKRR